MSNFILKGFRLESLQAESFPAFFDGGVVQLSAQIGSMLKLFYLGFGWEKPELVHPAGLHLLALLRLIVFPGTFLLGFFYYPPENSFEALAQGRVQVVIGL